MTDQEHFGLTAAVHAAGVRVVLTEGDEDAILAAVTPRTRLIATSHVLWTTGRRLDLRRVREAERCPGARRRRAVRRRDRHGRGRVRLLHRVGAEVALRARADGRALRARPRAAAHRRTELSVADVVRADRRVRREGRSAALRLRLDRRRRCCRGLLAALAAHPEWRYERAAEQAARCRELLEQHVEVVTPPGHSTLVSFRPPGDPTELVAALEQQGVIVRELPGRNLVRASCGWWTSEDDLQRLVAGVADRGLMCGVRGQAIRPDRPGRFLRQPAGKPLGARRSARSAAAPRRPCGCGRRARRRAPPRPCRRPRGARRPRTTAASASCAPTSARAPRGRSAARARTRARSPRARRTRRAPSSTACRAAARDARHGRAPCR